MFSWRGQFSPEFIETLLIKYANSSDIVYDPFLGSGTLLNECIRLNISAIGVELNPSAFYISKFYELSMMNDVERQKILRYLEHKLSEAYAKKSSKFFFDLDFSESEREIESVHKLFKIITGFQGKEIEMDIVVRKWQELKSKLINLPYTDSKIKAVLGDSRYTKIKGDSASLVITSPPYINVFNYHQNYRKTIEDMGYNVLEIAKSELGSNRKNRGNRYISVIQYSIDMSLAIKETLRISKNNSRLIFVVGKESKVLGRTFYNSRIIYRIFTEIFNVPLTLKQNRVFTNRFGKDIVEDILHFECKKDQLLSRDEESIIGKAREIGKSELIEATKQDSKSQYDHLLKAAIDDFDTVSKS